ncbi:MAG: alpha/beta fold hydrolase [Chloroflexi bacterium]|nr:alpha/beta fold hydrolase [Chloroflexota bacterium]
MGDQKVFQRHGQRLIFANDDLDFFLLQFLGYVPYEGASVGECLHTAAQINEKDPASWVREWTQLAARVESLAAAAAANGHDESARKHYLRASTYHRAASALIPPGEAMRHNWDAIRRCFQAAAARCRPAIETVAIPYCGHELSGYFVPAVGEPGPRPTLIMVGGGEVYSEEMYFWAAAPGRLRGYHTLLVDLPGHVAAPFTGLDVMALVAQEGINGMVQSALRAVVDYLLARPDVDAERLVSYGISGGGYMVTAAAAVDERLKAVALSTPIIDMNKVLQAEWPPLLRSIPGFMTDKLVKMASRVNPVTRIMMQRLMWNAGVDDMTQYLEHMKAARIDPRQITMPALCMASEKDPDECIRQTHETYDLLPNARKAKVIFTAETGADAHCQLNNPELVYATLFDWLDETLGYTPQPVA